uniref:Uncharacterized protein n=1 Tax=Trichinella nativa TaxID=6335 RepID=A0A0V1KKQ9_9BILA
MARNTEKRGNREMHSVGPGDLEYGEKTEKLRKKMRHRHGLTWNMARNIEKHEKLEMHTVGPGDLEYGEKYSKIWKMRNAQVYDLETWIMARKVKYFENETQTLFDLEVCRETLKKVKNEKCTLQDLEYGEKHSKM